MSIGGILVGIFITFCVYICILWNCSASYRAAVIRKIEGDRYRGNHRDDEYTVQRSRDVMNQGEIEHLDNMLRKL